MKQWPKIVLFSILLISTAAAAPSRAQEELDWRFGVVEAYTARNAARELQIGWTRARFHWAEVQAGGPAAWTPELSDEEIAEQLAAGREVVGLLIGIPEWARDEADLPAGLWLDHEDQGNLWASYVREIVSRYDGRIDHWIIWNEPDIEAGEIAHSWDGSVEDFYQLQRVAYLAAKESNPDSVIHLPAFTYWADVDAGREQYMARLLERIVADPQAAEHNYYFDVATAHLYFQADQIYDLLGVFQQIMDEHGLARPIWLVETNAPPYDDEGWPVADPTLAVSSTEQAAFLPQAAAAALAGGAERISVYKLRDTDGDRAANPEPFGLLRRDGSRRVAYTTYREAVRLMRGTRSATRERWDAVGLFRLQQEDRRTTVLFSRLPDPQTVEVEALSPTARLIDMWGQEQAVAAQDGRYIIDLQQALCTQTIGDYCMIGGTVLYLVEALDGGPPPEGLPAISAPAAMTTITLPTRTATAPPSFTPRPTLFPTASATRQPPLTRPVVPPLETATATEALQTQLPAVSAAAVTAAPTEAPQAMSRERAAPSIPAAAAPLLIAGVLAALLTAYFVVSRRG